MHLRHVPDQVLPWLGFEEEALAFRETLPDTPAIYDGYVPATVQPSTLDVLDASQSLFPVVNQMRDIPNLAPVKLNDHVANFNLKGKFVSSLSIPLAVILAVCCLLVALSHILANSLARLTKLSYVLCVLQYLFIYEKAQSIICQHL